LNHVKNLFGTPRELIPGHAGNFKELQHAPRRSDML